MKRTTAVLSFVKRNAVYMVLALCVLALGIATTIVLINRSNGNGELNNPPSIDQPVENPSDTVIPDEPVDNPGDTVIPDEPVDNPGDTVIPDQPVENPGDDVIPDAPVVEPITFVMPVANSTSMLEYSNTMVFNSTLNRFSAHLAIDFFAPEGTDVLAVYGGTVKSVENTLLKGVTITIDHGEGLMSVYNSLADGDMVTAGQTVEKGQVIGQVSTTNRQEYKSGAHLHFEVLENGSLIDPSKYLAIEEK